ncbi:MAG: hypothetical protein KJ955_06295 [Nanoarchaeota archaeon]|nr:hypothetical protein [Nanoarchaeota archaeon]
MKHKKKSLTNEWWDEFEALEGIEPKIEAVKELCALKADKEFYKKIDIGEAVIRIGDESKGSKESYHNLLDTLRKEHADIFDMDARWYIRDLIYYYISKEWRGDIKGLVEYLVKNPKEDADIICDLLDVLIVNGFTREAWRLLDFYYFFLREGGNTIDKGIFELSVLAGFFIIYKNVDLEGGTFSLEAIKKGLSRFDCEPKKEIISERLRIITSKEFHFAGNIQERRGKLGAYFLTCEFMRHLLDAKKTNFVCAHMLQEYMFRYISETKHDICDFNKEETGSYLGSFCSLLSLGQTRAFIILCAMFLFYDFLYEKKLIEADAYTKTKNELNELKDGLFKAFEKSLWKYKFTETLFGQRL